MVESLNKNVSIEYKSMNLSFRNTVLSNIKDQLETIASNTSKPTTQRVELLWNGSDQWLTNASGTNFAYYQNTSVTPITLKKLRIICDTINPLNQWSYNRLFDATSANLYWGVSDFNNSVANQYINVDFNNEIFEYYTKQDGLLGTGSHYFHTFEFSDLNIPMNNNQYITLALTATSTFNYRVNADIES